MSDPNPDRRWPLGEAEIEGMLQRGELDQVEASPDHADHLLAQADGHLDAARPLVSAHPPSAFTLSYDAARKAMAALLAKQGLRATAKGGHLVVQEAVEAQLGRNTQQVVRSFRRLRRRRNESEYPDLDTPEVVAEEAEDAVTEASGIVAAMRALVPRVGPWNRP